MLPYEHIASFMRFLAESRQSIQTITYGDLDLEEGTPSTSGYDEEWKRWRESLNGGARDKSRAYVLLHHDIDARPKSMRRLLRLQLRLGLRANYMLFARRIHRAHLEQTGEVLETTYPVDWSLVRRAAIGGVEFGYHCNAVERARGDLQKAAQLTREDVDLLRGQIPIRFYSPHGGPPTSGGGCGSVPRSNVDAIPDPSLNLIWVHNRHSPRFNGYFSDGGLCRHPNESQDLAAFVATWRPGHRYRVLLHPQYYLDPAVKHAALADMSWYVDQFQRGSGFSGSARMRKLWMSSLHPSLRRDQRL
ncbi:MAG: hypothetical protein O3C10_07445 [Chloroflexi bacterium]|nr:hypothetical protein [Chloroflexota bacterium]